MYPKSKICSDFAKNLSRSCSGLKKPWYSGSLVSPALCGITWSEVMLCMCPSYTQANRPPLSKPPQAQSTSDLPGDGPEWNTPRRNAHSQICDQRMPKNARKHCHFFSPYYYYYYFIVEHSSNICLFSIGNTFLG
jgi:hypothetical protein